MANKKKKVVVVSPKTKNDQAETKATSRKKTRQTSKTAELTFGKENYKWVLGGLGLIALGMILMIGGFNEDPNVWDESAIYGFRRTVLAPFVILTGLAVEIYAIFR